MSVATVVAEPVYDGRDYPELPQGMYAFSAAVSSLGDSSGGIVSADLNMNPQADASYQPYVAIFMLGITTAVAAQTGGVNAQVSGGHFETAVTSTPYAVGPFVQGRDATRFVFLSTSWRYFGKVVKDTTGTIFVQIANVDTATSSFVWTGVKSDKPFIPNDLWRL